MSTDWYVLIENPVLKELDKDDEGYEFIRLTEPAYVTAQVATTTSKRFYGLFPLGALVTFLEGNRIKEVYDEYGRSLTTFNFHQRFTNYEYLPINFSKALKTSELINGSST